MENTHGLMSLSEKAFQAKILANYHQKLTGVFWKSVMISRTYCDLTRGVYRSSPQPPGPIAMPTDQTMVGPGAGTIFERRDGSVVPAREERARDAWVVHPQLLKAKVTCMTIAAYCLYGMPAPHW